MPEHFRREFLTMGRYTNPACFTFFLFFTTLSLLLYSFSPAMAKHVVFLFKPKLYYSDVTQLAADLSPTFP